MFQPASQDEGFLGGMALRDKRASGVRAMLRHRSVAHAVILTAAGYLRSTGLPVDRVERAFLCDAGLPGEWRVVLSACMDEPVHVAPLRSTADVLRILVDFVGIGGKYQEM